MLVFCLHISQITCHNFAVQFGVFIFLFGLQWHSCSIKDIRDALPLKNKLLPWSFCLNSKAISEAIQSNCPFNLAFSGPLVSQTKAFLIKFSGIFVQKMFPGNWFPVMDRSSFVPCIFHLTL